MLSPQTWIVEEARWSRDGLEVLPVVVKTYRPNILASEAQLQELIQECQLIQALDHRRAKRAGCPLHGTAHGPERDISFRPPCSEDESASLAHARPYVSFMHRRHCVHS